MDFHCRVISYPQGGDCRFILIYLPVHLDLPSGQNSISGYVDALAPGDSGQVQCLFVNLSPDEVEAIHRYVLIRQKEVIRSLRATR